MLKELKEKNNPFKIVYQNKELYIVNYTKLLIFDYDHILVSTNENNINIKGKDLIIKRYLEDELLVQGEITSIELR